MVTDGRLVERATSSDLAGDSLGAAAALVREARDRAVRCGDVGCGRMLTSLADALERTDDA